MNEIFVVGHRNPDTDSIVAAMSYAALRNALGDREYTAACLGHISDETQRMLDKFGFEPPRQINDVRTQVRDLDFDTPPALNSSVTMHRAWRMMREQKVSVIPVINEDGTLHGTLSAGDIASYSLLTIIDPHIDDVPLYNVLSVLEGKILNEDAELFDCIAGNVVIALPQSCDTLLFNDPDSIVLCGDQPDMVERALKLGVNCIVLCQTEAKSSGSKTRTKPASCPRPLTLRALQSSSIRRSPSLARATPRIRYASILATTSTMSARKFSKAAIAATPCSMKTKRSSAHCQDITCCVRAESALCSLTTTKNRRR